MLLDSYPSTLFSKMSNVGRCAAYLAINTTRIGSFTVHLAPLNRSIFGTLRLHTDIYSHGGIWSLIFICVGKTQHDETGNSDRFYASVRSRRRRIVLEKRVFVSPHHAEQGKEDNGPAHCRSSRGGHCPCTACNDLLTR